MSWQYSALVNHHNSPRSKSISIDVFLLEFYFRIWVPCPLQRSIWTQFHFFSSFLNYICNTIYVPPHRGKSKSLPIYKYIQASDYFNNPYSIKPPHRQFSSISPDFSFSLPFVAKVYLLHRTNPSPSDSPRGTESALRKFMMHHY